MTGDQRPDMGKQTNPVVTVLIPARRDSEGLRRVLEIVRRQANSEHAEVLLVFNSERRQISNESVQAVKRFCDRVEFMPTPGKSAALNHGVKHAQGEVIAFTDDDTIPQPGWLTQICKRLGGSERDPGIDGLGGRVIPIFGKNSPDWFRRLVLSRPTHYLGPHHDHGPEPLDYPVSQAILGGVWVGANLGIRREVFDSFQFSESLGPSSVTNLRGGEETALGIELLGAGRRILYEPNAIVHHPVLPERETFEFVRGAYYAQGRESIAVRRYIGLPLPSKQHLMKMIVKRTLQRKWNKEGDFLGELSGKFRRAQMLGEIRELLHPVRERL